VAVNRWPGEAEDIVANYSADWPAFCRPIWPDLGPSGGRGITKRSEITTQACPHALQVSLDRVGEGALLRTDGEPSRYCGNDMRKRHAGGSACASSAAPAGPSRGGPEDTSRKAAGTRRSQESSRSAVGPRTHQRGDANGRAGRRFTIPVYDVAAVRYLRRGHAGNGRARWNAAGELTLRPIAAFEAKTSEDDDPATRSARSSWTVERRREIADHVEHVPVFLLPMGIRFEELVQRSVLPK